MTPLRFLLLSTTFAAALFAAPARAQTAADITIRLDRLEGENRRLNGEVERLGNQVRRLEDQLKRFQSDVDFRFKEGGSASPKSADAPPAPTRPAPRRSDAFDPAANPGAAGAPRTIGQLAAEAGSTPATKPGGATASVDTGPGAPAPLSPGSPGAKPTSSAAPTGSARASFDAASGLLERSEYEAAELAFRDFLKTHGKDRLKADALFGLGESFYRRNRYREAAEQYLQVTTDHPKAARAPEAMLKLGMSLRGLGATPEACGTYSEVVKKYPNATAAIKQAVDREKKRAQCAA